jgi:hypothetical protein
MIESKHLLKHCAQCSCLTTYCATCGNNTCNAGSGKINGEVCPDCEEAYQHVLALIREEDISFANIKDVALIKEMQKEAQKLYELEDKAWLKINGMGYYEQLPNAMIDRFFLVMKEHNIQELNDWDEQYKKFQTNYIPKII